MFSPKRKPSYNKLRIIKVMLLKTGCFTEVCNYDYIKIIILLEHLA